MERQVRVFTFMLPALMALGVEHVFQSMTDICYGGTLESFETLSSLIQEVSNDNVDVLLLGYSDTFDAQPQLLAKWHAKNRHLRVVFLLEPWIEESALAKALRVGADAYLTQTTSSEALVEAVLNVAGDKSYLEPTVTQAVLEELRKPAYSMTPPDTQISLTHRERMMLQLAADGLNNVRIADVLNISEKTIRHAWSGLFQKTGFNDRTQAVMWAIRSGYAELR